MVLTPMRFKNYVWPHNPRVYEIGYERTMASHKVPGGLYVLQSLGRTNRVMRGEGEFVGEGAYDEFKKLATVFYEESPGMLVHPVWQNAKAWLVKLSLQQEPREDYVRYSFEFWECYEGYDTAVRPATLATGVLSPAGSGVIGRAVYTVKAGDTLLGIANAAGVEKSTLMALNPGIRNPNLLETGSKIYLT